MQLRPPGRAYHLKDIDMNAPAINTRRSPHPLIWAAGIAIIVFCAIGIAALFEAVG